jgi:hypothetical protein
MGNPALPISEFFEFTAWDPYNEHHRCLYSIKHIINPCGGSILPPVMHRKGQANSSVGRQPAADRVTVFPNPATAGCYVAYSFAQESRYTFIVRDVTGRELYRTEVNEQTGTLYIDLSRFTESLYLIECRNQKEIIAIQKIAKIH